MDQEFLLANADFVRLLARSLVADEHLAEDVAQEAWLAALRHPPSNGRAWFASVVRKLSYLLHRREGRRLKREQVAAQPEEIPSTDEILDREVEKLRMVKAVKSLKEPYRSTIVLRFYENLPPREISRHMDIPVETVKTRLQRALGMLRRDLDRAHGGDGRSWAHALLPVAGLEATVSTVLKGAVAMSLKAKIGITTAAVFMIGATVILWQSVPETEGMPLEVRVPETGTVVTAGTEVETGEVAMNDRELMLPEEVAEEGMPAAYREALGGFKGRVLLGDGAPAPDRTVELLGLKPLDYMKGVDALLDRETSIPGFAKWTAVTGDDGVFHIRDVYPRAFFALVVSPGETDSTNRLVDAQPNPGETVDLGDITIESGAVIEGKVVKHGDAPLPGTRIRAVQLPPLVFTTGVQELREGGSLLVKGRYLPGMAGVIDPPQDLFRMLDLLVARQAKTGTDGSFRLENVPFGSVIVVADRPGFATQWTAVTVTGSEQKMASIRLEPGGTLHGKVVDGSDRPLAGVEVRMGPFYQQPDLAVLQPPVFTDENGRFIIRGLPGLLPCSGALRREGTHWKIVDVFRIDEGEKVFRLGDRHDLKLLVCNEGGRPVEGAAMRIRGKGIQNLLPGNAPVARIETAGPGLLVARGLAPGRYEYVVSAKGYGTRSGTVSINDEPVEREVTLASGLEAVVRVMGEDAPLEWAEVMLKAADAEYAGAWLLDTTAFTRRRTDATGEARFEDMAAGSYRVVVSHPGFSIGTGEITLPAREETQVTLTPGGSLEGEVLFGNSGLAPPFAITLESMHGSSFPELEMPRTVLTDVQGRFEIRGLNPGEWQVAVQERYIGFDPSQMVQMMMSEALAEQYIKIEPGETTRIQLAIAAADLQPLAFGQVSGRLLVNSRPVRGAWITSVGAKMENTAQISDSGTYFFEKVPAGNASLFIKIPPGTMGEFGCNIERRIHVAQDYCNTEDFDILTGGLYGRVVLFPGETALGGAEIRVTGAAGSTGEADEMHVPGYTFYTPADLQAVTDAGGNFRIDGLPAGTYNLEWARAKEIGRTPEERAFLGSAASACTSVTVKPGDLAGPAVVTIYPPDMVSGRVVFPAGSGEGGHAFLVVSGKHEVKTQRKSTVTIPDTDVKFSFNEGRMVYVRTATGKFEINDITPGAYRVKLIYFPESGGQLAFKPLAFEVPPGGVTDLVLRAEKEEG